MTGGPPATASRLWHRWGNLLMLFGIVAAFGVAQQSVDRAQDRTLPDAGTIVVACGLLTLAQVVLGFGWVALCGRRDATRALLWSFHGSQLGKYLPGGVWQALGQVNLAVRAGVPAAEAGGLWLLFNLLLAAAGLFIGGFVPFLASAPNGWQWLALAGLLGCLALLPNVSRVLFGAVARVMRSGEDARGLTTLAHTLPMALAGAVFVGCQGLTFALLVRALDEDVGIGLAVVGYGTAYAVGLLAAPIPAGIGVREAVLVMLVGTGVATTVTAALLLRMIVLAVEGLLFAAGGVSRLLRRPVPRRSRSTRDVG